MNTATSYYTIADQPHAASHQWWIVGSITALSFGLACGALVGFVTSPSSLHIHPKSSMTRPSMRLNGPSSLARPQFARATARQAKSGDQNVGAADVVSSEWPAETVLPKKVAHPHPHEQSSDAGVAVEDMAEALSQEWPAETIVPKKLAHPHPGPDAGVAVEDMAEALSQEWPAETIMPKKLAHPHPGPPVDIEDVAEALSQEWPAETIIPKKVAHPHHESKGDGAGVNVEDMAEALSQEWPAETVVPKKVAHPHKDGGHGSIAAFAVLGMLIPAIGIAAVTGKRAPKREWKDMGADLKASLYAEEI